MSWLVDLFTNSWNTPINYNNAEDYYIFGPEKHYGNLVDQFRADGLSSPYSGESQPWGDLPINSPVAAQEAADFTKAEFGDASWLGSLFQTAEQAAVEQARRNEDAAVAAWQRSEQAADSAMRRARELRQTAYQDAVKSLKAAGLNPVLAAGGGISGSAVTAPQANAPSSSSGMASGINGADLLTSIAAIISSAGNLMKGISSFLPSNVISQITGNYSNVSSSENTSWIYHMNGRK